jgi:hypothetical protein
MSASFSTQKFELLSAIHQSDEPPYTAPVDNRTGQDSQLDRTDLHSVQEVARILGISVEATRKRLQRGQLHGVRYGGRWYVNLADRTSEKGQDATEKGTRQDEQSRSTVQSLVNQLRTENAYLQERLQRAEEERAELRRMLNFEQQTVRALTEAQRTPELPVGRPEAARNTESALRESNPDMPPPSVVPFPQPSPAPQKRPWWAFWRST